MLQTAVDVTATSTALLCLLPPTCICHYVVHEAVAIYSCCCLGAEKHLQYGNVLPMASTMPPFVVEHAGGINKQGMGSFRGCREKALNQFACERCRGIYLAMARQGVIRLFLKSLSLADL